MNLGYLVNWLCCDYNFNNMHVAEFNLINQRVDVISLSKEKKIVRGVEK